jgi:ABC-2 type transport system ATP-binding protein
MIIFKNAAKTYGSRTIIHIPQLQLPNGIYWVKGRNGSGKTTLLRMLAGMIPFSGEIIYNGTSLQTHPLHYRGKTGWAEAEPQYPGFLSGREILNFYQHVYRDRRERVKKLIESFGIEEYLPTQTGSWSDGMIKRLSLLLAFIGTPQLILLDEPLATLDAEAQQFFPSFLSEYYALHECTILFSSHQSISTTLLPEIKTISIGEGSLSPAS